MSSTPAPTLAERGITATWARSAAAAADGLDLERVAAEAHETGPARRPGAVLLRWRSGRAEGVDATMVADVAETTRYRITDVNIRRRPP